MTADLMSTLAPRVGRGPAWLEALRREAAERLRSDGFPGKKHERWRFTPVRDVVETPFERAAGVDAQAAVEQAERALGDDGTWRVVVADGPPVLQDGAPEGVRAKRLTEIGDEPAVRALVGALVPAEPFAALNAAMFEDALVLRLERSARPDRPVHLVHVAQRAERPTAAYPRVLVWCEPGSEATLVETFVAPAGRHLTGAVTEVALGAGARLAHARLVLGGEQSFHLAHLAARLERDAAYGSSVVTLGGRLSRLELDVELAGEGAEATLEGVYHARTTEHVDHHLRVDHAAPHGTSHVRYRGLLDGAGRAVFDAIGRVRSGAPGASAHQDNRNLLLDRAATVDTKPHLEIETDDVKASHGATVGAIDDAQLFYLRSRGIPLSEARDLLTFAFVRELLDRIAHRPTAARATDAVLGRLASGQRVKELLG